MKFVVATETSTLILWWRASLLASPTVFPASVVPWRGIAPVRARIPSSSVVLPLWNGPTSAMHRGPDALVPFCAMYPPPNFPRCGPLRDRLRYRFRPEGDLARGTKVSGGEWNPRAHVARLPGASGPQRSVEAVMDR